MFVLASLSRRERNLWVECVVDVLVLFYYLPKVFLLAMEGPQALMGGDMAALIVRTVVYAIVLGIVVAVTVELLFRAKNEEGGKDEREVLFELKSYRVGYYALVIFVMIIMGQAILSEIFPAAMVGLPFEMSAVFMAHCLLLSLSFSSLLLCGLQLFYYRRGY